MLGTLWLTFRPIQSAANMMATNTSPKRTKRPIQRRDGVDVGKPVPMGVLRSPRKLDELLRCHAFGFRLEVHHDAMRQDGERHRVDVVEIRDAPAIHRRA